MRRRNDMKTNAQPRTETSTTIAVVVEAFCNHHADRQRCPCQKGTRRHRCTPCLHRPPPWRPETPRDRHTTKVVFVTGLQCLTGPPPTTTNIEAANTPAPKDPCAPASETMPIHIKDRSTPLGNATDTAADSRCITTRGCQICLLINDRRSVCTKGRE
jgi:hypothetical protein